MKQSSLQSLAGIAVVRDLGRMRFPALVLALTLALPASAHEDLDGSYDDLALAYQGSVAAFVTDKLRDPKSAQYRKMRVVDHGRGKVTICGEVNARNGYGGCDGFEPFAITAYPTGDKSRYVPTLFDREMRPILRRAVSREGC